MFVFTFLSSATAGFPAEDRILLYRTIKRMHKKKMMNGVERDVLGK